MSRPLTPAEKDSIQKHLALLGRLLDCYRDCLKVADDDPWLRELRGEVTDLAALLADGKIDIEIQKPSIGGETDRKGIHLNPDFGYSLPPDWELENCGDGYHTSFWKLTAVLMHEHDHWKHDIGLEGFFRRLVGVLLLPVWGPLNYLYGHRNPFPHERRAYQRAYLLLGSWKHVLEMIKIAGCECFPCVDANLQAVEFERVRQNPRSDLGG